MKLILVRGLPGSGKSTIAKSLRNYNTYHFEADAYFMVDGVYKFDKANICAAHMWCQQETEWHLNQGCSVICSNTFTTKKELKPYFEIAKKFGIIPNVILCQNQFQNVHLVPEETMTRMKDRFCYDISSLFE